MTANLPDGPGPMSSGLAFRLSELLQSSRASALKPQEPLGLNPAVLVSYLFLRILFLHRVSTR